MSEQTFSYLGYRVGGNVFVSLDFDAGAVAVTIGEKGKARRTEELGGGVLVDWDEDGKIVGVEVIAAQPPTPEDVESETG